MDQTSIELRSERIRNIIGRIPPFFIRWGNLLLFFLWTLLFIGFVTISFPYKVEMPVRFNMSGADKAILYIPSVNIQALLHSERMEIRLSAYSFSTDSPVTGIFDSMGKKKVLIGQTLYREVVIRIESGVSPDKKELYRHQGWLEGKAVADMGKVTYWNRLFHSRH